MPARLPVSGARFHLGCAEGIVAFAVLAAAVLAVYCGYAPGVFVFDDFGSVLENPTIRRLWPPGWLLPPVEAGVGGRPLANLSFALDHAVGGLEPWAYHWGNICGHLLAAFVLWALVRRTLQSARLPVTGGEQRATRPLVALLAAVCWAVHPLTSGTVGYASQRTEILMALCCLLTLLAFSRYTENRAWGWAAAAVAACAGGMGSKESMVMAPLLVWLYDRAYVSESWRSAWQRHGRAHLALAGTWTLLAGSMLTSGLGQRGVGFGQEVGAGEYLLTQSQAVLRYLRLGLWPHPLVFDYGWDFTRHFTAAAPTLLGCGLLVVAVVVALRRWPAAGFAGAWWLLLLAPTSSVIPIVQQPIAENRAYLPLAGLIALGVVGGYRLLRRRVPVLLVGGGVVALGLGVLTARRAQVFSTEVGLWRDTVEKRPTSARANGQLGAALLRVNLLEESVAASQTALRLRARYPEAQVNLGVAFARMGRLPDAVAQYEAALRHDPHHIAAHYNLGLALAQVGRRPEAEVHLEAVLRKRPHHALARNNLSVLLLEQGRATEAAAQAQAALAANPALAEAHYNLGNALARTGDLAGAAAAFEGALRLQSGFAKAHNNLGVVKLRAGRPGEARAHFEAALRAQPDYAEARRNLDALMAK